MIPFPNVIAGILIGFFNDSWIARLVVPFGWGIIFCFYTSIFRAKFREARLKAFEGGKARWGLSPVQSFYLIEYMTASATSLIFSILSGLIRSLF